MDAAQSSPRRSRFLLFLFAFVGIVAARPFSTFAKEPSKEIEAKVALESSLEKRLQTVLRQALGSDDLIVIVDVALSSGETAPAESEVMPGVPPRQASDLGSALDLTRPMVNRLSATIVVDEGMEEKDLELARKISAGILGISTQRGDSLTIEKIRFHKPRGAMLSPVHYAALGACLLWLLFAAGGMMFLQKKFLAPLLGSLRDMSSAALLAKRSTEREADASSERDLPAEKAEQEAAAAAGSPRPDQPFSFISAKDVPKLSFILGRSSVPVVATIIHYLPTALAARVLAGVGPDARREVVLLMSKVNQLEEGDVRPLEDSIRKGIDFLMGGEDRLVEILDAAPPALQKDLLAVLDKADHAQAKRLSQRLIFIEDMSSLEPAELKLLCRRVPAKVLAVVLKASSETLRTTVLGRLAAGTREWLLQEMELSAQGSAAAVNDASRRVLAAFSELVRDGRVTLRKEPKAEGA